MLFSEQKGLQILVQNKKASKRYILATLKITDLWDKSMEASISTTSKNVGQKVVFIGSLYIHVYMKCKF